MSTYMMKSVVHAYILKLFTVFFSCYKISTYRMSSTLHAYILQLVPYMQTHYVLPLPTHFPKTYTTKKQPSVEENQQISQYHLKSITLTLSITVLTIYR